ncbi:MAG: TonB-dependent receptor, partial [Acidihalobacter sp.]|uniref:TonB-dependent receptor n=1 Tax=Acidihalobacter sp. TaxID=1872108 RepID=UPI00307E31C9
SVNGNSIGAAIVMNQTDPQFAAPGKIRTDGNIVAYYRTNGDANGVHLGASVANNSFSMMYKGDVAQASDYKAGGDFHTAGPAATDRHALDGDVVGSSAYDTNNQLLAFAYRHGTQSLGLSVDWQDIPYEDYANQRMDMVGNKSSLVHLNYKDEFSWGNIKLNLYHQNVKHTMNFDGDKQYTYGTAQGMPMNSDGRVNGAKFDATIHLNSANLLRTGLLLHSFHLNDYWPPTGTGMMMSPNTFYNVHDAHSNRYDAYLEWRRQWTPQWTTLIGARSDTVVQSAGDVQGYSTMYATDANAFNAQSHNKTDRNWNWSAQAKFKPAAGQKYTFGVMRQEHSPNLYQRYTWSTNSMAAVMNNLVGDGNGYVGNLNLKPEVAYTANVKGNWTDAENARWKV